MYFKIFTSSIIMHIFEYCYFALKAVDLSKQD